jgi:OFA family oxalate/formate antiporter-like MFS transporter
MLTAWGFASAFGPLFIAHMRETAGSYRGALHVIAGVMAISTLLPILVRPPRTQDIGTSRKELKSVPKSSCDPLASLD